MRVESDMSATRPRTRNASRGYPQSPLCSAGRTHGRLLLAGRGRRTTKASQNFPPDQILGLSDDTTHILGGAQRVRGSRDLERSKYCKFQTLKDRSIAKFNGPGGGDALKLSTKPIYSNNLHVLSIKTSECMFDGSKTTSSSHHTLAATSSCRHSLSTPNPPSTPSIIIASSCTHRPSVTC